MLERGLAADLMQTIMEACDFGEYELVACDGVDVYEKSIEQVCYFKRSEDEPHATRLCLTNDAVRHPYLLNCEQVRELLKKELAELNHEVLPVTGNLLQFPVSDKAKVEPIREVVFLSGAVTAGDITSNRKRFIDSEKRYRDLGYTVIHTCQLPHGLGERAYMRASMAMIFNCDRVVMLSGWERSSGALAEYFLSKKLGLPIVFDNPSHASESDTACTTTSTH
jgi:hypothetical protein